MKPPTKNELKLVSYVEEHWHRHKAFPAYHIIGKVLGWEHDVVKFTAETATVATMLRNRGIEKPERIENKLTPEQVAAANVYLNIVDNRPIQMKLADLGISSAKFSGWMKGKTFRAYITERAEELFEDGMAIAHRELLGKVSKGDISAIRLFYEVSGRYSGVQSIEIQNVQLLMSRLLEAIQMEVTDQEIVARIGERFRILAAGGTLAMPKPPQAIAGTLADSTTPVGAFKERMSAKIVGSI